MLDVIIYEEEEVSINKNKKIIAKCLTKNNIEFRINVFKKYDELLSNFLNDENKKIYIINVETEDDYGITLAKKIRKKNINDIIILTAKCDKYYDIALNNRLMAFDYLCKCDDYDKQLSNTIFEVSKLLYNDEFFIFKYKRVIYRIPYHDINYIEKEMNIKRCIIHTTNNEYYITGSIDKLIAMLKFNFIKTHQSCIINLNNIKMLDCATNEVVFKNDDYTTLVTEKAKRQIKDWLFNN